LYRKVYIFLSFIPVALSMLSAVVLCFMKNRSRSSKKIVSLDIGGYRMLSIKDELEFNSDDSDDAIESELFKKI